MDLIKQIYFRSSCDELHQLNQPSQLQIKHLKEINHTKLDDTRKRKRTERQ